MNRNHLGDMMRLCSRREYAVDDIRKKLQLRELEQDKIEKIVTELIESGYLSDSRYANAYARDKSAIQGWGSAKIKLALQRKKISSEIIAQALSEIDNEASQKRFQEIISRKYETLIKEDLRKNGNNAADWKRRNDIRNKLIRFSISRGYSIEQTIKVLESKCEIYDN